MIHCKSQDAFLGKRGKMQMSDLLKVFLRLAVYQ